MLLIWVSFSLKKGHPKNARVQPWGSKVESHVNMCIPNPINPKPLSPSGLGGTVTLRRQAVTKGTA